MTRLACITLDMEPDHGDPDGHVRLLEDRALFERYVGLINKYELKVTVFAVTSLFQRFSKELRELAARIPMEFASHSHRHDPYDACSPAEIDAAESAFVEFTGARPIGYRAPIGRINRAGLSHLIDAGYRYDSSLYASLRPGEFGYSNLHMPNVPFRVVRGSDTLLEFPFTSISTVRIVFALSYAKLLGWPAYSALLRLFGLPDAVVALSHPYDFYTHLVAGGLHGLEKFALTRNAERGFEYFEHMVVALLDRGYSFMLMSELCDRLHASELPRLPLEAWRE